MSKHSELYNDAIAWIAMNDNTAEDDDLQTTAGYLTVALVADVFGVTTTAVAARVVARRNTYIEDGR